MKIKSLIRPSLGPALFFASALAMAGCHNSHPDEKTAVNQALTAADFGTVGVMQDRDKGVITLRGNVASPHDKTRAENIAQRAAPDYTIANELGVRPLTMPNAASTDAQLDSSIEDNFKAAIKSHDNLKDQSISGSSKNGTLVITGSVKTAAQKDEAGKLAKQVPQVEQVVNELEVKPGKHSTPSS